MALHEELEARAGDFKGTEAVLTFQSGFTANTGVIPTITGEQDLIVSRRAQPRLDHRRHAPLEGAAQGLPAQRRDGAARDPARGPRATAATAPAPYRLILVVTDGVFSMDGDIAPLPGDRRGGRGGRRRGLRRRRPRLGRAGARRPRHGRPLRPARPGRDPGRHAVEGRRRAGRLRGGIAGPARHPRSSGPARSCSRRPTRRRSSAACREAIRVMQDEPELHRAAVGQHPPLQGRAGAPRLRHRPSRRRRSRR